jgi:PAS domain S-box-containing protein
MASYAAFFYVDCTALVLIEGLVAVAFAVRSRAESSRKMALLALAYAWSAPMSLTNLVAMPGVPPDLPGEPLQVAPAIWLQWHIVWPLVLIAYAFIAERVETRVGRFIPVAVVAALAASALSALAGAHLPTFIGPRERIEPLYHVGVAVGLVLDLIVIARLVGSRPTPRDRWVVAAVALAAVGAVLVLASPARFTPPFFVARVADVASACAMLAAVIIDGFAVVRRAAQEVAERARLADVRAIADAMPQIVWQLSADNRNVYANARWSEYTGREREHGADDRFSEAIHPDDRASRDEAFARARDAGGRYEATYRLRRADGVYRYFLTRAVPMVRDGVVTGWIGTSTDIDDRKRLELEHEREARDAGRMRTLASIGRALSQSLDLDLVLSTAVSAPVPHIADWALLNLRNGAGELVVAAFHHRDPERASRGQQLVGQSYVKPTSKGGSVPRWLELMTELEPRSSVVVPLTVGQTARGTLNVAFAESGRVYRPDDLEMLEEIGRRIALAIENAEFYGREHRVADRLQRASLPASLPRIPGVLLDAVYQAGRSEAHIGGDWYDAFELDAGRLVVSVGDVMGSGLEAAATMGAVRQAMRGAAEVVPDPVAILDAADRTLRKTQPDGLVTAFLGVVDPRCGSITYASAGHPRPLVRRPDGRIERLDGGGLPIGLRGEGPPETASVTVLEDDALLVLYTDGLTEAGRDIAAGEARLEEVLAALVVGDRPAQALQHGVLGSVQSIEPRDDVAILTVGLTPARHRPVTELRCDVRDQAAVRRVRHAVVAALQHSGLSDVAVFDAELVLGELLGNVVRHAPPIADVRLDLSGPSSPRLWVRDRGPGCGKLPALPDQVQEWGRGLFLTSALVSELAIEARAGGGTEVRATLRSC